MIDKEVGSVRRATVFAIFLLFSALLSLSPLSGFSAQEEEGPTLQVISKTEAAKAFVTQHYQRALEEFQALETQYPKSRLIKRYLASTLDSLRRREEAIQKLNEVLVLKEDDLIARQMLGELYLKQAELDKATEHFRYIVEKVPAGNAGKNAKKKLAEIDRLRMAGKTETGKQMSPQDFMKSEAAQEFSRGNYDKALVGFDDLLRVYPQDILIRRFRGLSLLRLGRKDEAIAAMMEAIVIRPENAALHFYLGQAYQEADKMEEARKEFRWVIDHDETIYKFRAQQAMFQTLSGARPRPKPWSVSLSGGYEFDTNATFKSRDDDFSSAGDQNSGRYLTSLNGTYQFYQKGRWALTTDGLYTQTLYNDFPRLNTYTSAAGIGAVYSFNLFNKPSFFNLREGASHTILKNKFYVWSNTISTGLVLNPHPKIRSSLSYRWAVNEFESNGTDPDRTSRDGFTSAAGMTHTVYLNDARNFYVNAGYDFERNDTSGVNFVKNMHGPRGGIHFPLLMKVDGDISYRFKDSNFVKFSGTPIRRDGVHTFVSSLSRPFLKYWNLLLSYTYEDSEARNNLYEYSRHVFSVQTTLRY